MRLNRGTDSPINILLSPSKSSHTCRPTWAPTWPRGLPATWRALCASCAGHPGTATWPQCRVATRVGPARHFTLARAPRQSPPGLGRHITCRYVKPFFCEFLIRNSIYKSIKNPKKSIKLKKFIFLKIQLLLISNFLHWITNSFLFNIISFKIYFERRNQDELKFT